LYTGFGLMTEFFRLFNSARDYILQYTVTHTHSFIIVHSSAFTVVAW
jgi:hypothetical protein